MDTTLISLISDQLIPNLLFIKEKEHEVDRHLLVTTALMEGKGAADRLANVAGLKPGTWQKVEVIEDSLDDINKKLSTLQLPGEARYLLNLTGGTKIMSIGVNRFFESYRVEAYYATIGKNSFKKIFPAEKQSQEYTFSYLLSLAEYLRAYGLEIISKRLPYWATEELSSKIYRYDRPLILQKAVKELILWQQNNRGDSFDMSRDRRIQQLVDEHLWQTQKTGWLSSEEIQFLISGWWEVYVYHKLQKELKLHKNAIHTNCVITRDGGTATNELDVAFVVNNKLFVVECKTGFGEPRFTDEFNKAIYKMGAIRKDMGLRIPGYLFILDPNLRNRPSGQIKEQYANRANVMDTTLVDKIVLNDPAVWKSVIDQIK